MKYEMKRIILYIFAAAMFLVVLVPYRLATGHDWIAILDGLIGGALLYSAWLQWRRMKAREKWDSLSD